MEYYVECKPIGAIKKLTIFNDAMEQVGTVSFQKKEDPQVTWSIQDQDTLKATSHSLKPRKRFEIFNQDNEQVGTVKMGVKIIHSIIQTDRFLVAKASFWRLKYRLFDNRDGIGSCTLVRINKQRYFQIKTLDDDVVSIFGMFLLAHAIRIKALIS